MAVTEQQLVAGLKMTAPVMAKAAPNRAAEPIVSKPAGPQVIHVRLDDGPREIVMVWRRVYTPNPPVRHGEARAYRGEQDDIALLELSSLNGIARRQRDGCAGILP